ncbi:MAG: coenzyme F420-0:L-glutamate ligase [Kiritimatiellae bacterium]|nr:coenzyme F420-0:L-glutamate ligase [Kiritimatiellia bacterium]
MEDSRKVIIQDIPGIPEIRPGDLLAEILIHAVEQSKQTFEGYDILVLAHKIVSKAEGRIVDLRDVIPSPEAFQLAEQVNKDPRKVEVILCESQRIIRAERHPHKPEGVLICEHKLGFVSANAAVDESNVFSEEIVVLLPIDPDASARELRDTIQKKIGVNVGVIITDTFGRPWRLGLVNIAVGLAGVPARIDLRGERDLSGHMLRATMPAFADEIAASAGLLMEKRGGKPAILIKGLQWEITNSSAKELIRPKDEDLFLS